MKAVIQRVKDTKLCVDGKEVSHIEKGLVVFFGVGKEDKEEELDALAKKIANLRIFEDENERMNFSVKDINGQILLVSQFTLYADTSHGNRPSFFDAEKPERANQLHLKFCEKLKGYGIDVKTGVFGADMRVSLINHGPTTLWLDSEELFQ